MVIFKRRSMLKKFEKTKIIFEMNEYFLNGTALLIILTLYLIGLSSYFINESDFIV